MSPSRESTRNNRANAHLLSPRNDESEEEDSRFTESHELPAVKEVRRAQDDPPSSLISERSSSPKTTSRLQRLSSAALSITLAWFETRKLSTASIPLLLMKILGLFFLTAMSFAAGTDKFMRRMKLLLLYSIVWLYLLDFSSRSWSQPRSDLQQENSDHEVVASSKVKSQNLLGQLSQVIGEAGISHIVTDAIQSTDFTSSIQIPAHSAASPENKHFLHALGSTARIQEAVEGDDILLETTGSRTAVRPSLLEPSSRHAKEIKASQIRMDTQKRAESSGHVQESMHRNEAQKSSESRYSDGGLLAVDKKIETVPISAMADFATSDSDANTRGTKLAQTLESTKPPSYWNRLSPTVEDFSHFLSDTLIRTDSAPQEGENSFNGGNQEIKKSDAEIVDETEETKVISSRNALGRLFAPVREACDSADGMEIKKSSALSAVAQDKLISSDAPALRASSHHIRGLRASDRDARSSGMEIIRSGATPSPDTNEETSDKDEVPNVSVNTCQVAGPSPILQNVWHRNDFPTHGRVDAVQSNNAFPTIQRNEKSVETPIMQNFLAPVVPAWDYKVRLSTLHLPESEIGVMTANQTEGSVGVLHGLRRRASSEVSEDSVFEKGTTGLLTSLDDRIAILHLKSPKGYVHFTKREPLVNVHETSIDGKTYARIPVYERPNLGNPKHNQSTNENKENSLRHLSRRASNGDCIFYYCVQPSTLGA